MPKNNNTKIATIAKNATGALVTDQGYAWDSASPSNVIRRRGYVRAFVPAGKRAPVPKKAAFKAATVNSVHDRYLVEVPRWHARTGEQLPSQWLAPKAVVIERTARKVKRVTGRA